MKKFISGLIIGLMISVSVAFADGYSIVPNSFPIYVNGTQQNVDALNINGTTWIRLGSISGILGADATFDEVSKQIKIDTSGGDAGMTEDKFKAAQEADAAAEAAAAKMASEKRDSELGNTIPKYYTQNGLDMMTYNNKEYVKPSSIIRYAAKNKCVFDYDTTAYKLYLYDSSESRKNKVNPLLTTTYLDIDGIAWIEYDYYTDAILPLIQ